jgi:hypothetical protein|uniref:Uncharacterized protein n=1 Tax=uncultured Caudovirales phage TaxID=2100421 RepID=A0A6J5KZG4_9CAUD|nr:hypothetical protein UFOVP88_58 [uncultured Caudovirales phage]
MDDSYGDWLLKLIEKNYTQENKFMLCNHVQKKLIEEEDEFIEEEDEFIEEEDEFILEHHTSFPLAVQFWLAIPEIEE